MHVRKNEKNKTKKNILQQKGVLHGRVRNWNLVEYYARNLATADKAAGWCSG